MQLLKTLFSWFCLYLVGAGFFLIATLVVLFNVFSADNIKQTLKEGGVFEKIVPAFMSTATYPEEVAGQLPLKEPWVQDAANKAFPADDLEQKSSQMINGTFGWLEGQTADPEFQMDFTRNKDRLAEEIGSSTESRLAALPRCGVNDLPRTIDVFKLTCLPFGVNPSVLGDRTTSEVKDDTNFFKDTVITPESIRRQAQANGQVDPFQTLEGLRPLYQNKDLLLILLPLSALTLAILGVLSAPNRFKAVRRLYRSLLSAAAGLLVFSLLLKFGLGTALGGVARDQLSRDIISPVFQSLLGQAQLIYMIFAGVALVLGLVLYFVSKNLRTARSL